MLLLVLQRLEHSDSNSYVESLFVAVICLVLSLELSEVRGRQGYFLISNVPFVSVEVANWLVRSVWKSSFLRGQSSSRFNLIASI